jgi:hypothetical protein
MKVIRLVATEKGESRFTEFDIPLPAKELLGIPYMPQMVWFHQTLALWNFRGESRGGTAHQPVKSWLSCRGYWKLRLAVGRKGSGVRVKSLSPMM